MLSQKEVVDKLLDPANYPHKTESEIKIIETNISWVFLTGSYAYKMKKSIKFGDVLDFSTLENRKKTCENEISLNNRLAPSIYLNVESVDENGRIIPTENPAEYIVKMKQLPQDSLLSNKLRETGTVKNETIEKIALKVSDFHKKNVIHPEFSIFDSIFEKWDENFRTTRTYPNFPYDKKLEERVYEFLDENKAFWETRKELNKIVDGHGDLILANIFEYANDVIIFDCIEFNEMLRIQDILEEVSFLAMDLDYHGLNTSSDLYLRVYLDEMEDELTISSPYIQFYKSYRAYVRAKVNCSLSLQDIPEIEKKQLLSTTEKYMNLASSYEF
jgi:aminoglycoside phosphotransferase family enzyme